LGEKAIGRGKAPSAEKDTIGADFHGTAVVPDGELLEAEKCG